MVLALLSCGREPATGPLRTPGGVARGLSFNAIFPAMPNVAAFASFIDFDRVRVFLRHPDGTVALDTMVTFPAGADAISLSFDVKLAPGTPAAGELLSLNLAYLNAKGDTVFRGGPVDLRAAAAVEGVPPPPPVSIPVVYTGPGASAQTVRISPRTLTVNAGAPFVFTSIASNAAGVAVPEAPVIWVTPDPALASIPVPTAGSGTAKAARGTARVIAQLLNGASDTVTLNVIPVPTGVAVASGNNQVGIIGKPTPQALAQPIAVRVIAADGLGVPGVSVTFAAANGGSVSPATIVTDAAGLAQGVWSLGTSASAQTSTATVAGVTGSPITFNATASAKPAIRLVLSAGPAAAADIASGTPTPVVVTAQDADGDQVLAFAENVTVAIATNPSGGTLAGTPTVAAVGGKASFSSISIAKPGTGYVLQVTSGALTPVSTNAFNIVTGPAANIALVSGGAQTAEAGASLLPLKVLVTDANGNAKAGVAVAFTPQASAGTASPASVVSAPDGTATAVWTLGSAIGSQALNVSTTGVTPLPVTATAVAVVRTWVITQQPAASLVAGSAIAPPITAELRDAFNAVVPSFSGPTTIAIGSNPGGATLGGTVTANATSGVATFSGITLNKSGTGYTLVISASGTTQVISSAFSVTPAVPASLAIASGSGQSGTTGAALAAPLVAVVTDAFGNAVPGATVAFTIGAGGGSVTPASGTTDASGRVSATWTLGSLSASQSLSIASAALPSVTATATAASSARALFVTQQPSGAQAGAAIAPPVTVEMRDGFNALVPAFTGAVTISIGANPSGGVLSGATTVNAVAGVATFSSLAINKAATGYTLVASASGAPDVASTAFTITPAAAASLALASGSGQSGTTGAALAAPVVAVVTDAFGNPVVGATVAFTVATGGGSVTPASGATDASGRVSTIWTLGSASAAQSLSITSGALPSVTTKATASSPARALVFTQQPSGTQAGAAIAPAVTFEMRDGFNALVPTFTGPVTISIGANPSGGVLSGTKTVNAVAGVATFSSLAINKAATGYTLVASASGAPDVASSVFNVTPAAPAALAIASGSGQSGTTGAALAAPVVAVVTDAFGNVVTGATVSFAVAAGGGSVTPASGVTDASGRVSASWTLGSTSAAQSLSIASAALPSVTATATAASSARALFVTQQPSGAQAGAAIAPAVSVEMRDGFNALVPTFTGAVTISIGANPSGGVLSGTKTVNAVAGVATFSSLAINKAATGYTLVASASGAPDVASSVFNITPAAPAALAIASGSGQSGTTGAALAAPVVAVITDAFGNPVVGATVAFTVATGGGSITPASGATDVSGRASATWTLGSTSAAQSLSIASGALPSVTATATAASSARALFVTQQPSGTQAGAAIAPAVSVEMRDGFNALVPTFTGPVTISIGANPSGGVLSGTTTVNAVAGVATFSSLAINKAATGYTLVASASGAPDVASSAFNVTSAAAASLVIASGNGQTGVAGAALAQSLIANLTDKFGNPVAGASVTFTVSSGGGSITPATASTDANGQVSTVWTLGSALAAQTVSVASNGAPTVTATATATSSSRTLVVTQQPGATQTAGVPLSATPTFEMHDGFDAIVPGFTGPITLALGANCCGSTLSGTLTVNAVAGVASFPGISLNKRGGGYTLAASAASATGVTTSAFTVGPAAAASLVVASGNAQTGSAGAALPSPIVALVTDALGNGVPDVGVTFSVTSGGGSVAPPSGTTDATGRISTAWTMGSTASTQGLDIKSTGLTTASATATASGAATTWFVTAQPAAAQSAGTVTPAIVVELRDGSGAVTTSFNGTVTASILAGPEGATLGGTTAVTAASGSATFASLSLTRPGPYTLAITSAGAGPASTTSFTVSAAAAAALSVQSGGSQTGTFGAMLAAPVVLKVTDVYGNAVSGKAVTFTVASGGGSVGSPSATTDGSGFASTTWTLGPSGAQTLTGASTGLTGSPLTISAVTANGSVARTVVSPRNDTLTSLGATRALSAQARDVGDNVVAGTFSWVSRDPSIATVSSGGVVTAVANGSVYVVAQELGGTRDSAFMVVQQRVATVNVTPASRSLYTGGTFSYSALAVDGRGNAMASQPTFTWTSTSPSVASANASTGFVTALAIGSTQIRATAGAAIGVSLLTVQTPIKRIVVTFDADTASSVKPDTFTMTALGLRRAYRAIARDTLDAPMTGVTFTWSSTNGSVAAIDAPTATTAGAIAAANGITSIQASAQSVTGGATLLVAQVLASIELTPASVSLSVGGNTAVVARGKDSQNRYISGGSFAYASSGPSFASVNATTGVVTGVANGTANITATSGTITSNVAVVNVTNEGGPAVISFGRDTIGIGRGTSLSIPILLSKPSIGPLVINLAAADTNAFWSTPTITIAAGSTAGNATLRGRNAGTTRVTAVDGSGSGYAGATAVVAVQANMRLTTTYYSLNETDQVPTQVVLSDPSPVGGTYVTFSYGTEGKAQVSPDPAFIPAGQLAADIVIRAVGAGTTTVTPLATGVSGTGATVAIAAAALSVPTYKVLVGAGQSYPYLYVTVPNYLTIPLDVTLANNNSAVLSAPPSITIPAGTNYKYFDVATRVPGTSTITATATGWTPASVDVIVSTPKLSICCAYTLNTSSPAQNLSVYTTDSLGSVHARVSSLAVRVTSSDTSVIKVLDSLVTVPAGSYYTNSLRVIPNGTGGTAWVLVTAGGHTADSISFTVLGPALSFSSTTTMLGVGQVERGQYLTIPNGISKPLVVTLTNSDSTFAATDATVTVPAGQTYAYFETRGRGVGTSNIIASAPGYIADTISAQVTVPSIRMSGGSTLNSYSSTTTNVYVTDANGTGHNRLTDLTVSLRSSDTSILDVDATAVIPAGSSYVPASIPVRAVSPGTVKIYVTAPGHAPDSSTWTVLPSRVSLSWRTFEIGARQHQTSTSFYVYIPTARATSVPVTLTHTNRAAVSLSTTTPTIQAGSNYAYLDFAGVTTGVDTVVATAAGYTPDTAYIRVSTPRFTIGSFPTAGTTTSPAASVLLYVADSSGYVHYANDTVVVHAVSSDSTVIKPTAAYFRVLKDAYYTYTGYQFVGPGTATITYSDSAASAYVPITSNTATVTGPSLSVYGSPGMLGTGQHTFPNTYYVSIPNPIGTPLTVALISTDPRVATVPETVVIPAGQYYAYFTVTARDTIGTVQIQATGTGYTPSSTNIQVTQAKLVVNTPSSTFTTSPSSYIVVYAEDANGNTHPMNADLSVSLLSSAPGVASIDSSTITIVKDAYYSVAATWSPGSVGSAQLSASDNRAIRYPFTQGIANVAVNTPPLSVDLSSQSLGLGQYLTTYVSVPNYRVTPLEVTLGHATSASSTAPSVTITPSLNYQNFLVTGLSVGVDTITASAPGHISGIGTVSVAMGHIDPLTGWVSTLKAGDSTFVRISTRSPNGTVRRVAAATTFTLAADANVAFTLGGTSGAAITSVVVPAYSYNVDFYVKAVSAGTANVTITNANYVTYTNSATITP